MQKYEYSAKWQKCAIRVWSMARIKRVAGNEAKTIWDIEKTTSYVEKIMSDVVFPTSDIIFAFATV